MDTLAIIAAKYLWIASPIIAAVYFWRNPEKRKSLLIFLAFSLPATYVAAKVISQFFYNARPFVVQNIAPLIPHAADNGFPSDHTLIVAAFASAMLFFKPKLSMWLWVITLIVGWGRVYADIHHTIDVLGSIVISIGIALVVYLLRKNKEYAQ